jgi:hypothetical protein
MADTVANTVIFETPKRIVISSVFTIDGTEAADLVLADKSAYTGPDGSTVGRWVIEKIEWELDAFKVLVEFEHTTDDEIAVLTGTGFKDYTDSGRFPGFVDPNSTGGTGDIVATTLATDAGDEGSITLYLRKKD